MTFPSDSLFRKQRPLPTDEVFFRAGQEHAHLLSMCRTAPVMLSTLWFPAVIAAVLALSTMKCSSLVERAEGGKAGRRRDRYSHKP